MSLPSVLLETGMKSVVRLMRLAAHVGGRRSGTPTPRIETAVAEARQILVVALAEIGDAVLLSPFLRELRHLAPRAHITLVVRPAVASLFARCPFVDLTLTYEPRVRRVLRPLVLPFRSWRFARRHLRGRELDVAIVPRWDTDHHFASAIAYCSGAARRLGYSEHVNGRKATLNAGFDGLLTDVVPDGGVAHEVERHLALLRYMGADPVAGPLETWLEPEDEREVDRQLSRSGVAPDTPLIAFLIGAADPKRRWPADRFALLGDGLLRGSTNARVLIIGGSDDVAAEAVVLAALGTRAVPLAGRLTLRQSAAALRRCVVAVGNDSGALHLAAASGVPCVEISCHPRRGDAQHNNAPERFGPWGVPSTILRPEVPIPPCDTACRMRVPHCILGVEVDDVVAAVMQFAEPVSRSPGGHEPRPMRADSADERRRPTLSQD